MCAKRWPSESVNTLYLKTNKQVAVEQSRKKVALHWNFSYRLWSCTWGSWQEKANSYIVYLDMSKAFNSISHNILLQKLKAIWLAPSAVSWFNSYWINAALSDVLPVVCGVSQSSVLAWNPVIQYLRKQRTSSHWDMLNRTCELLPWWHEKNSLLYEGCPILRQIYAWHNVLNCIYSTVQKRNKKKKAKQNNEKFNDAMHKFVGVLDKYVLYSRLGMSCYWGYKLMIT